MIERRQDKVSEALGYLEAHWSLLATISLIGGAMIYSLYRTGPTRSTLAQP